MKKKLTRFTIGAYLHYKNLQNLCKVLSKVKYWYLFQNLESIKFVILSVKYKTMRLFSKIDACAYNFHSLLSCILYYQTERLKTVL